MSAKSTDRSNAIVATTVASPTAVDGLRNTLSSLVTSCVTDLSRRRARASRVVLRFVCKQAEFNQVARFVLAVPLAIATPSYVGFDGRPQAPESMAVVAPGGAPPSQSVPPSDPGGVQKVGPSETRALSPADVVAGPRIRAICSRAEQTVFLDDRAEVDAPGGWREEVALKHPGAVCAFTTRYGVADPQFKMIETNRVTAPAQVAPSPEQQMPVFVKTIPVPSEMLVPPDLRAGGFSLPYDKADPAKDQIEQALAALSAPTQGTGARIVLSAARSASMATPLPEPRPLDRQVTSVTDADSAPPSSPASLSIVSISKGGNASLGVNAEILSWGKEALPIRDLDGASRLWRQDTTLRMGAFGEEQYRSPSSVSGFSSDDRSETSDLQALERFADFLGITWVRSGFLLSYPHVTPPVFSSFSSVRRSGLSPGNSPEVDFDAAFAAFSKSERFD